MVVRARQHRRLAAAFHGLVVQRHECECGKAAEAQAHLRVLEQYAEVVAYHFRAAA